MLAAAVEYFGLRVWTKHSLIDHHQPHRHNEIELNYIERGAVTYIYAGHEAHLQAGEHGVFWGAVPHQLTRYEPDTVMNIATVPLEDVLQWELASAFLKALLSGTFLCSRQLPYNETFYSQWALDVASGNPQIALLEIRALLQRCAGLQSRSTAQRAVGNPNNAQQMARFMSQHFKQPLTISDVAACVGLHPHYAMAVFKGGFGNTIVEYLTQQRVAYVQQQLLTTDRNVTDIAYDAGFQTVSHFYDVFKRWCGTSPGIYRATLRQR